MFQVCCTNKYGCRLVEQAMKHHPLCRLSRYPAYVISNAYFLATHRYGNFIVQALATCHDSEYADKVKTSFNGKWMHCAKDVYGKHVVIKCIKHKYG